MLLRLVAETGMSERLRQQQRIPEFVADTLFEWMHLLVILSEVEESLNLIRGTPSRLVNRCSRCASACTSEACRGLQFSAHSAITKRAADPVTVKRRCQVTCSSPILLASVIQVGRADNADIDFISF
jgi:hypothetical protein